MQIAMSQTITPFYQKFLDLLLKINQYKVSNLRKFITAFILAILMFGKNVHAKWWVIDDHEIASFLGSDHILHAREIPGKLFHETEVGNYLRYPRFRPIYYLFRLTESWAWGGNQALWYLFRIGVFTLFISTFWFLTSRHTGDIISGIITLYIATSPFWLDIVGRLGPSEIYAALGLTVFGLGVNIVFETNKVAGWWYLFLGSIICSGAKENFLFLLMPLTFMAWDSYQKRGLDWIRRALFTSAFTWMIWIGITIFIATRSYGGDVYNNAINFTDRLLFLLLSLARMDVIAVLFLCALIVFWKPHLHSNKPGIHGYLSIDGYISILLILSYLSQIFFYGRQWPLGNRYDFPGILVFPLLLIILARKMIGSDLPKTLRSILVLLSLAGIAALLVSSALNIRQAQLFSQDNVEKTIYFTNRMEEWALVGKNNPQHAIIIQTDNPSWDYEPVFSYARFLQYFGVQNNIAFLWTGRSPDKYPNENERTLAKNLSNLSAFGETPFSHMNSEADFTPFPEIDKLEKECILIVISGEPEKNCPINIVGQWR